jgi:hypothetical protein
MRGQVQPFLLAVAYIAIKPGNLKLQFNVLALTSACNGQRLLQSWQTYSNMGSFLDPPILLLATNRVLKMR